MQDGGVGTWYFLLDLETLRSEYQDECANDSVPSAPGWTCQDVLLLDRRGDSNANTYFMCKSGAYTGRSTWYREQFACK